MTVGVEKLAEVFDLSAEFLALVCISHPHAMGREFNQLRSGLDVETTLDGVLCTGKRFVLDELEAAAVVNERIACNARLIVISLGETAVDNHQFAISFDGVLTFGNMDGYVTIDDMAIRSFDTEGVEDAVANLFVVAQAEVVAFLLLIGGLVRQEVTFEGGHLRLVEEGRILAAPKVEEIVASVETLFLFGIVLESRTHHHTDVVHEVLATETLTFVELHFLQGTVVVEWYGGMEQQVLITDAVHATVRKQHLDVFLEFLADTERMVQTLHELMLLGGELVGIGRVNGGEMARLHLVLLTIDDIDTTLVVDMFEYAAVFHLPFRTAVEDECLLLELDDADGLMHLSRQALVLILHRVVFQELRLELLAGVVTIDLHSEGSQWYKVDAVGFLDGRQVGIAQTQAQDVADAGVVACTGTHPQYIMITPLDIP